MASMKKELYLEGLECALCAEKIEKSVKSISGVSFVSMDFKARTLAVEIEAHEIIDDIIEGIELAVKDHEPNVIVREKVVSKPQRKVLMLMGLGCATCAAKIEKEIKNLPGVKYASLDFVSRKLTIEAATERELDLIAKKASEIVERIEKGVKVTEEGEEESSSDTPVSKRKLALLGGGAFLFLIALIFSFPQWVEFILYAAVFVLAGGEVVLTAVKNIKKGRIFDENFLMTIAALGAFAIGEFPEGAAVIIFYQIGEMLQDIAVNRSRRSIADLMNLRPDYVNLKDLDGIRVVSPGEVKPGDIIVVKPGERVPLDGVVAEGSSSLDTSALTGESMPREVEEGGEVLSGSINIDRLLEIKVTKPFSESTVSRILELVESAGSRKAPSESFMTKFAGYYTPAVVFAAAALALLPPLLVRGESFSEWVHRALVFLVASCPCALVISIPLGFFGGIGGASKNGILIKGGNYLEALNNVDTVVFDKTGTLTKGVFTVSEVKAYGTFTGDEVLRMAAYAESYSTHPIAASILNAYGGDIDKSRIKRYGELSGYGVKAVVDDMTIIAGNSKLMKREGIDHEAVPAAGTVVHVASDGIYAGCILIADEVKQDSRKTVTGLRELGVDRLVMLTGDSKSISEDIGSRLELDEVYSELLPDQKVEKLEMLYNQKPSKGKLVFVGDGINDAPVLARADVGVAMGGIGSDAAIEAADVVIMTDEPSKLVTAIKIAKKTKMIVWQNIIFAMLVKVVVLVLGAGGISTMWEAVFADVGVALLAVLNSMRAMRVKTDAGTEEEPDIRWLAKK